MSDVRNRFAVLLAGGLTTLALSTSAVAEERGGQRWENLPEDTKAALLEEWEAKTPEEQEDFMASAQERRQTWDSMSETERAEVKKQREMKRGKWESLSAEDQETYKSQREERKANWQSMSEDERRQKWEQMDDATKEEMRQRRDAKKTRDGG